MASPDPFALFHVEAAFDLDLKALEQRHRELSKALHPDRHANAPARERREALGRAIEVNEAWRLLKDPIRRAEALCRHLGIEVGEDKEPKADPMLLMEMMEQREALADARRAKSLDEVTKLAGAIRAREAEVLDALKAKFSSWMGGDQTGREALLKDLGTLRYYRRFLDEAAAIEDDLL